MVVKHPIYKLLFFGRETPDFCIRLYCYYNNTLNLYIKSINFLKIFPKTYLQTKKNMVSYKSTLNMERWSSWFKAPVLKIGVGL